MLLMQKWPVHICHVSTKKGVNMLVYSSNDNKKDLDRDDYHIKYAL